MTTGRVVLNIGNLISIDGTLQNGKIVSGTYQTPTVTYTGEFDENGKLHGDGKMIYKNKHYAGIFEHGKLISGTEHNDSVNSEGKYEHYPDRLDQTPVLIEGTKYHLNYTEEGKFRYGNLIEGTVTYKNGIIMKGIWNDGIMHYGIIENNYLKFKAKYSIRRNRELGKDLLSTCQVEFKGDPTKLPNNLLLLYACRGNNCANIHSIYTGELERMQGGSLLHLFKYRDQIRRDFAGFELPIFDEMMTNLTTTAVMDGSSEIQPSNIEMFGTYYSSHD